MRKTLILLTLLAKIILVHAQTPIGIKYDLNGMPLNGYFDPIIYSPDNNISHVHNLESYENGYYYDSLGNKIKGLIKFENDKILFKKKKENFRIKLKPDEIRSFVVGVDSFFVVDKFYFKYSIKEKPEFVQYIAEFNGNIYAKHYHFNSSLTQQYGMQPSIIETFLVKQCDSIIWDNFHDNSTFEKKALKYFGHIPYLKGKIVSGEYDKEDMLSIIKMAEYLDKYNNSKPIYYDRYWQEVRDSDKATYSSIVSNKADSLWTFEYYKGEVKLYQGVYSSFYPNRKNGEFIAFYPNGETRQIVTFLNNKPKEVKTFYTDGLLETHYIIIENEDKSSSEPDIDFKYITVNDSLGENILNSNKESELTFIDTLSKLAYTKVFKGDKLSSVYRVLENDTVFQITNPDYEFKIKSLQKKFDSFMSQKSFDIALSENAQGTILISLLIDKKGYVMKSSILNNIHPELDKLAAEFVQIWLLIGLDYKYKFKPYKKNKVKRHCEVVIPFEFSINRIYRQPVKYNQFYHWHMHEHMMRQQMMQHHINNVYRRPLPGGF